MSRRPNIVLIITDQERSHRHWPPGWAEQNLPTYYDRLIGCQGENNRSSVVFPNAFTATTECSPSRASLLTSSYPTEHGVKTTPGALDPRTDLGSDAVPSTDKDADAGGTSQRPNLMRLLSTPNRSGDGEIKQHGYDVAWKGKWHLSPPFSKRTDESSILKWYGATTNWNPPDAGHSLWHSSTLGGGSKFNHDGRYLRGAKNRFGGDVALGKGESIIDPHLSSDDDSDGTRSEKEKEECIFDFLAKHALSNVKEGNHDASEPFFLIASLVNPHDVWASSCFSNLTDYEFFKETGYHPRDFENLPIELPPNHEDDLSTKPLIQSILQEHRVFGNLADVIDESKEQRQSDALRYIRFYAHLHTLVDAEIASLLDAVVETGQMDNTIIIRMADHGELALSHGLREKRMQSYEETMGIPLVINYPNGWFDGDMDQGAAGNGHSSSKENNSAEKASSTRIVPSLISSIDILPTIAECARVDCSRYQYRGKSLVPFLRNDQNLTLDSQEEEILFTFDEPLAPPGVPGYVRCVRTPSIKYTVYFTIDGSVTEYEMYNLEADPLEMVNLCGPNISPDQRWYNYHERLTALMVKMGAVPTEFDWVKMSKPKRYSWA